MEHTAWLPAALRPSSAPWAVRPALSASLAAAVVAGADVVLTGNHVATGLAYFGVACAAVFLTSGGYRLRAISLMAQGIGAFIGIVVGVAVADSVPATLAVAAGVAMLSGMLGAIGPMTTAGALMAAVGLGFGEFARLPMPGWEQGSWYLVGTLAVAVGALAGWPIHRDRIAWIAVASVFDRAADLAQCPDRGQIAAARAALATAVAATRSEVFDHRLGARFRSGDPGRKLTEAADRSEGVAFAAAAVFAARRTASESTVDGWRRAATDCRAHRVPAASASATESRPERSLRQRFSAAARLTVDRPARLAGFRLMVCMTIATAVTCALHSESHSYWIPLTVAVAVRPEYASVFVRSVNRVAGTLAGALLAAGAIALFGSGWPVALAAALALGFAVLAAPKLYGLGVIGVTCSALLSSCIGVADPVSPVVRLLDTLIGCGIAVIFGYLAWAGRKPAPPASTGAAAAITAYLRLAVTPPPDRSDWAIVRDRAYRLAHQGRQMAQAATLEPQRIGLHAPEALPHALILEALVDEVTAMADRLGSGAPPSDEEVAELTRRIEAASV